MPDTSLQVVIPNRALFKAAEVCELVKVQPYVLRSWEAEFPDLGVSKIAGGPRVYRRADVEQVARIRHLLLVEGLTLAGARRRIDDEATLVAADEPLIDELVGENARQRLTEVKRGLQSILELLAAGQGGDDFRLAAPIHSRPAPNGRSAAPAAKPSKGRRAAPARRRRV